MTSYRFFVSGLAVMILFALGHFGGFLAAVRAARQDPGLADLTRAMREKRVRILGFEPSILDFREYFSLNFSILLSMAAAVGFAALGVAADRSSAIGSLAPIYAAGMLLLLGTSLYFSVVQGIIASAVLVVLFGLSWWFP